MAVLAQVPTVRMSQAVTMLVVDTGAALGLSLARSLRQYGYNVEISTSVSHAIAKLHGRGAHLLLIHDTGRVRADEVNMLRRAGGAIPCLVLANDGSALAEDVEGPNVLMVSKPLEMAQLLGAAKRLMRTLTDKTEAGRPTRQIPAIGAGGNRAVRGEFLANDAPQAGPRSIPPAGRVHHATGSYSIQNRARKTLRFIPAMPG